MAWTTPGTAVAGDVLTAAFWNTQVRDNLTQLGTGYTFVETIYFTSSGSFTKASYPYLRAIRVKVQAGGGGGAGAGGNNSAGGSGGGGGYAEKFYTDIASLSASETVTVGAGGAGGAAGNNDGSTGGSSSFGSILGCGGGVGGNSPAGAGTSAAGGAVTVGTADFSVDGEAGITRLFAGGFTIYSTAQGGASFMGVPGKQQHWLASHSGMPGTGYGPGGNGGWRTSTDAAGAAGGSGIVIVELFA